MVIRRIGVLSAAKIGGILGVAIGLLAGIFIFLLSSIGGFAQMAQAGNADPGAAWLTGMGAMAMIMLPLMYGVFMFIGAAIQAFIYNIAARFVGGLVVETD